MKIIDSQVHTYERNHPGRPWVGYLQGPPEVTGDNMVAAMDAVGVDGALLISPYAMYRFDGSYARDVHKKHPKRFGLIKPFDPNDPAVAEQIAEWAGYDGTVGVRIMLNRDLSTDPADPGINRVLAAGARHGLPVNLLAWGRLEQAGGLAARNPNTQVVIDHVGLQQPMEPPAPAAPFADIEKVLALAARGQYRDQDFRRLHALAPAVPVQGYLGPARAHFRCLRVRALPVGDGLDTGGGSADVCAGGRRLPRHRSAVRQ